jgi:hypothetical protein
LRAAVQIELSVNMGDIPANIDESPGAMQRVAQGI